MQIAQRWPYLQAFISLFAGLLLIGALLFLFESLTLTQTNASTFIDRPAPLASIRSTANILAITPSYTYYLPLVFRPYGTIYGQIFENGWPAPNISVTLYFCDQHFYSPKGDIYCGSQYFYTVTDQEGRYEFKSMPTLTLTHPIPLTQTYLVFWINSDNNPARLAQWQTRILDSYTFGDVVNIGNFDIGNVRLTSPFSGTVVGFPTTFRWLRRGFSASDSYNPCIFGGFFVHPVLPPDVIGCGQPLGYVDHFTLPSPFAGIDYDFYYTWRVQISSPDGGKGETHENVFRFARP